jgi:hypothetical protein
MKKKIKCLSNENLEKYLTVKKVYEVLEEDYMYLIVDDSGLEYWHYKKRFQEVTDGQ